jgi:acyl-coenzyme A synthetase/AMP-(fatty) acid ligase
VADGATEAELDGWCRERLAGYKVPRRWLFVSGLPRSEGGKLLRRRLER